MAISAQAYTLVQRTSDSTSVKPWFSMGVADDKAVEGFTRLTLEVPTSEAEFIRRFAAYRNALARAQNATLRKQWTRKMMAENAHAIGCDVLRKQLQPMFEAVGDFPELTGDEAKDADIYLRFAKRVIAWDKKADAGK